MFKTFQDIEALIENSREETQALEFKREVELDKHAKITRSGKREISKHVGGMVNGAGGVIVIGIETKKSGNIDRAHAIHKITNVGFFADQLRAVIDNSLMPQKADIKITTIIYKDTDEGVIVVNIPKGSGEPSMSTAAGEHRYYRRGIDGTYIMDHLQIKQKMFSHEAVSLECNLKTQWSGSQGVTQNFEVAITLKNVGALPAKNPTVQVFNGYLAQTDVNRRPSRTTADGRSYFLNGQTLLYPGEEVTMATHKIYIKPIIKEMKKHKFEDLLNSLEENAFWDFYDRNPHSAISGNNSPVIETKVKANFAAENASLAHFEETVSLKNAVGALRKYDERVSKWLPGILR